MRNIRLEILVDGEISIGRFTQILEEFYKDLEPFGSVDMFIHFEESKDD